MGKQTLFIYVDLPRGEHCVGCNHLEIVDTRPKLTGMCTLDPEISCNRYAECFGYANEMNDYLERKKIKKVTDCKTCSLLVKCLEAYDERVYYNWGDFDYSLDSDRDYDPMFEDLFEDEDDEF